MKKFMKAIAFVTVMCMLLSTVAFAVLEVNGELSVLLKSKEQPATLKDLRIEKSEAVLPLPAFAIDFTNHLGNLCLPMSVLVTGALVAKQGLKPADRTSAMPTRWG